MKEKMGENARFLSLDNFEESLRGEFNGCIDQLSRNFMKSPEWWVSGIASRDTYGYKLYSNIVSFLYACEKIRYSRECINVKSPLIGRLIKQQFPEEASRVVIEKNNQNTLLKKVFKAVFSYPYVMVRFIALWLAAKFYGNKKNNLFSSPDSLTLVDTFLFANSFDEAGVYKDRYYGSLKSYLNNKEKKNFFYIPTRLDSLRGIFSLTRRVRGGADNFILQEDILFFRDYIWAFLYPFRALKFFPENSRPITLRGINVTPLFKQAWFEDVLNGQSVSGLLKYRIGRRLKERGVKLRLVVNWFENQPIDKGFNMGIRQSYKGVPIVGYQGFVVPNFLLCMNPSQAEYDAEVLPTEVAVCGPGFIEERKKNCPKLDVCSAPAFRFQQVYNEPIKTPGEKCFTILVALHLTVENAIDALTLIAKIDWKSFSKPVRVVIKPHPCMKDYLFHIKNAGIELGDIYQVNTGDFASVLDAAHVFMSNTSSTCLEALAKGKPVLIIGSRKGSVTQNPIPENIKQDFWSVVRSESDAVNSLNRFFQEKACLNEEVAASYKDRFFTKVTKEACNRFLKTE